MSAHIRFLALFGLGSFFSIANIFFIRMPPVRFIVISLPLVLIAFFGFAWVSFTSHNAESQPPRQYSRALAVGYFFGTGLGLLIASLLHFPLIPPKS